jgi:phage shock protein A
MGLFDRIGRVVRANMNDLVSKAEDPKNVRAVRYGHAGRPGTVASGRCSGYRRAKRTEQQYNQNQNEATKWGAMPDWL